MTVLAITQVITVTLLAPALLRSAASAAVAAGVAATFLVAATAIAPAPSFLIPPTLAWMLLWLLGLTIASAGNRRRTVWLPIGMLLWLAADAVTAYAGQANGRLLRPLTALASGPSTLSHFAPLLPLFATALVVTTISAVICVIRGRGQPRRPPQ